MIDVKALISRLRRTLKDEDENSYTDEELTDYINDAIAFIRRIIIPMNPEYIAEHISNEMLYADNNEIMLPNNVQSVVDVRIDGKKLRRDNISSIKNTRETGEANCYCLLNRTKVVIFPRPIKAYYYEICVITEQPLLSIDDKTPFPNDFDTLIFEYVVIRTGMGDMFQMSQELSVMGSIVEQVSNIIRATNESEDNFIQEY